MEETLEGATEAANVAAAESNPGVDRKPSADEREGTSSGDVVTSVGLTCSVATRGGLGAEEASRGKSREVREVREVREEGTTTVMAKCATTGETKVIPTLTVNKTNPDVNPN